MKACRILFSVGMVAVLATPTWAQTSEASPPSGEFYVESTGGYAADGSDRVENAVASDNGRISSMIQPAGFVLLGDKGHQGWCGGECGSTGPDCRVCQVCEPRYSGCSTSGCQTFGDCPDFCGDGCMIDASCIDSCCGNRWEFRGGWINMKRVSEDVVLVTDATSSAAGLANNGVRVDALNGDDFAYDHTPGVDATILYGIDGCSSLEFRYLWIDEVDAQQTISGLNGPGTFAGATLGTAPPTVLLSPGNFALRATSESQFQTAEINVRNQATSRITLIGGFRYAELDESLAFQTAAPANPFYASFDAENDLYGFQGGAEVALVRIGGDCFRIDGLAKAGVYYNDVRTEVFNFGPNTPAHRMGSSDDSVAFLGEFGLYAHWKPFRCLAFRAGYQAIWFNSIATAEHQVSDTSNLLNTPVTGMSGTGDNAIFHGVNVMVIGTF